MGLDVHKSSVRLAAMKAGEVLAERTLAHDHEAVIAALQQWPGASAVGVMAPKQVRLGTCLRGYLTTRLISGPACSRPW